MSFRQDNKKSDIPAGDKSPFGSSDIVMNKLYHKPNVEKITNEPFKGESYRKGYMQGIKEGKEAVSKQEVIEILKELKMEEKTNEDFMKQLNVPSSDCSYGHSHGHNQAVSEQNTKIQAVIDNLTDGGKHE